MNWKKILTLTLVLAVTTSAIAPIAPIDSQAKAKVTHKKVKTSKYLTYDYRYKATTKSAKKSVDAIHKGTSAGNISKSKLEPTRKNNKKYYGFTYVNLKTNQTFTLNKALSLKEGYIVDKSHKTKQTLSLTKDIKVSKGLVYYHGKRLTGAITHKSKKHTYLSLVTYDGKVIQAMEMYY